MGEKRAHTLSWRLADVSQRKPDMTAWIPSLERSLRSRAKHLQPFVSALM
jgi:hypothetical protein